MPPFTASEPRNQAARILVVDDHAEIREPMALLLDKRGFLTDTAADGQGMRAQLARTHYDLVLLDVMLPDASGFALCEELQHRRGPPVILLTAVSDTAQRVRGLDAGAEDYVVKPFEPAELLARIRTVLRRALRTETPPPAAQAQHLHFNDWRFDVMHNDLLHRDGRSVQLSAAEARLLKAFLQHPQQVLSRDQLLELCAASDSEVFDRSIDTQISRLRRKLEPEPRSPRLLKTAWGSGYLFAASVRAAG